MVFYPAQWFSGQDGARYTQIDAGVAWYHNNETYRGGAAVDDIAGFIGLPVVGFDWCDITFGWMQPFEYTSRGRPYFGLTTKLEHWTDKPLWLFNPGIGIYGMASPYEAYGVNLNLISWRF
jgi:hypothetical protein